MVSVLSMLFQHSMSQARSAYAAIVMFPSMSSLKFDPAIRAMKQQWNASSPQYAAFWCGTTVLQSLVAQPVNFRCRIQVRNRLIIVWRLLHLYRSVDLAHLRRLWAKGPNGELYIAAQRKGWLSYRWERVMVLPNHPNVCPLHLIVRYMHITPEGAPRGPLLIALVKPHGALSSDRVGALTKHILQAHGVDVTHYKPHTTRGAGKLIHKQMNLPPRYFLRNRVVGQLRGILQTLQPAWGRGHCRDSAHGTFGGAHDSKPVLCCRGAFAYSP